MSLHTQFNRTQALLALIIQEASKAAREADSYVGRTALQKLVYFAQVSGVPTDYSFDIHFYGPYCYEITRDTEWLTADQVISDGSKDATKYSKYAPDAAIDELLRLHTVVEEWRQQVRTIVNALTPFEPERLELMATLDYVFRMQIATRTDGSIREAVIERFLKIKNEKFKREDIEAMYTTMENAGLLKAA